MEKGGHKKRRERGEKVGRTKGVSGSVRVISQLVIFTLGCWCQPTVEEKVDALQLLSIEKDAEKGEICPETICGGTKCPQLRKIHRTAAGWQK